MSTLNISNSRFRYWEIIKMLLLTVAVFAGWSFIHQMNWNADLTMGYVDPSIWLLILIAIICYLFMIGLSSWIMLRLWAIVGLPAPKKLISQFNYLEPCQKLNYLLAAYSLLLLAGVGCLAAIC